MINEVILVFRLMCLEIGFIGLRGGFYLGLTSGQRDHARVHDFREILHHFRRVALRIDRNENRGYFHPHFLKNINRLSVACIVQRADIGTESIAEIHEGRPGDNLFIRHGFARLIDQRKRPADGTAGHLTATTLGELIPAAAVLHPQKGTGNQPGDSGNRHPCIEFRHQTLRPVRPSGLSVNLSQG